jgi:hypothetical protein
VACDQICIPDCLWTVWLKHKQKMNNIYLFFFLCFCYGDIVSLFSPSWPQTLNLPASASQMLGITGVHQEAQPK